MNFKQFSSFRLNSTIFLLLALSYSNTSFATVSYLSDNRQIVLGGDDGEGNGYNDTILPGSETPFADFSVTGQASSLTSTGFSASGSGFAYSDFGFSFRESIFDITFNLSIESSLALTGYLEGIDQTFGSGDASIKLYSGTDIINSNLLFSDSVAVSDGSYEEKYPEFNSILTAGAYRIVAKANPYFQIADSSFSVNAEFTPTVVPIPTAVWFFSSGLFALVGFAKRTKN